MMLLSGRLTSWFWVINYSHHPVTTAALGSTRMGRGVSFPFGSKSKEGLLIAGCNPKITLQGGDKFKELFTVRGMKGLKV